MGQPVVVRRHLCLVLSTMTVLQGDTAVAALLQDAMTWAKQADFPPLSVHVPTQQGNHCTSPGIQVPEMPKSNSEYETCRVKPL